MQAKSVLAATITLSAALSAQAPDDKLHPYLADQLNTAAATEQLPVYFVIADRLGYDHWFPRVFGMSIDVRRETVMRELREHADRTQENLVYYLGLEVEAGNASDVSSNWLGNFVKVKATPTVIRTAAGLPSVGEVWFDYVPPLHEVEDSTIVEQPLEVAGDVYGPPPPPAFAGPGPAPLTTRADKCWALGFEGQGVVIMNSDSGIDTNGPNGRPYHRDWAGSYWNNALEGTTANGIDDDGNGKIDDLYGWNFGGNNPTIDDNGGHGSNTAGCLVANGSYGNGTNTIYGMAPRAEVMTGRLSGESSQWDSVQYAIAEGAHTQTSSHSYKLYFNPPPNYKMHRDIGENSLAAGLIRSNSTSNDGGSCSGTSAARKPFNISAPGNLPPPYLDPNQTLKGRLGGVIGVGAWDWSSNTLKSYSPCGPFAWHWNDVIVNRPTFPAANWDAANDNDYPYAGGSQQGLIKPDIASPTGTTTTDSAPTNYTTFSGTSNATPVANGCMAILKGANMSLTPEDIAMLIHQNASDRGSVPGKENDWGAGVIDCYKSLLGALCVHRVDGQPAWEVNHSVSGGPLELQLDGVPGSLGAMIAGFSRQPVRLGPVTAGVGNFIVTLWFGVTDRDGHAGLRLPVSPAAVGLTIYTQALHYEQIHTPGEPNRGFLASNVIGVNMRR